MVTLAAEFPNDNPALHRGVSWLCLDVTGAAVAVRDAIIAEPEAEAEIPAPRISGIVARSVDSETELADDLDDDFAPILVEELPPLDEIASLEGIEPPRTSPALSTSLPPASDEPFTILVFTLADVALGAGSPHVASVLPALLLHGRLEHAMPPDASQALAEAGVLKGDEVTPAFVAQTHAWRALLLGTSDDFAACGNAMLDEWAADLLARLLGAPSRATALRSELRSRGVAAFGLVEAA